MLFIHRLTLRETIHDNGNTGDRFAVNLITNAYLYRLELIEQSADELEGQRGLKLLNPAASLALLE